MGLAAWIKTALKELEPLIDEAISARPGSTAEKSSKKEMKTRFIYSFTLMDLGIHMYIGYGTSFQSEKDAFLKAVAMARSVGVSSLRLNRYYRGKSSGELLEEKFGNATVKNAWKWKRMLHRFVNDTHGYLRE